jgi:opacity protein-like surface antigen
MRRLLFAILACLICAPPAYADATLIIGRNQTPSERGVKGFAFGFGQMIGFEFEYASNGEQEDEDKEPAPALKTFMGNVYVQTPVSIAGFQPYGTVGIGFYHESFDAIAHDETAFGSNAGVGVKITIWGPIKARIDYRRIKLSGEPFVDETVHRVYSGFLLKF